MAKGTGWKQSLKGVKTRSYTGGVDSAVGGASFGAGSPKDEPAYNEKISETAGRKAKGSAAEMGATDQAKGYDQADRLNKMGSNRL